MIANASSGIPRIINAVCDAALVYGYALHAKKITINIVQEVLGRPRQIWAGAPCAQRGRRGWSSSPTRFKKVTAVPAQQMHAMT